MTEKTIQVVAMVADNGILTFYKTDGSVFTVTQGDALGLAMTDEFVAQRALGKQIITLPIGGTQFSTNHLDSPKRSKLLRFFTAPIDAIKKLFGADNHEAGYSEESHEAAAARVRAVAASLMSGGPSTAELPVRIVTSEQPLQENETIIAVSADGIVPHVENLSDQFEAANEEKAPDQGVDNLLLRLAKISSKRGHTATDVVTFLKSSDLTILEDGSYLAYKRLNTVGNGVYVDPYTSKVHQRIGDTVQMSETMVDPNRSRDCSNGLHVGARSYMGSYSGSATMLVLVQPEDAIAVPSYGTTKMRVCRYTILGDLSADAHRLINSNKSFEECKTTMELLASIVAGARPPMLGVVNIAGPMGTDLTYTINGQSVPTNMSHAEALAISEGKATAPKRPVTPVRTIDPTKQGNDINTKKQHKVLTTAAVVKPADLAAKAAAKPAPVKAPTPPKAPAVKPVGGSRADKAQALYAAMNNKDSSILDRGTAAQELADFKKKAKVSWSSLGLKDTVPSEIETILDTKVVKEEPVAPKLASETHQDAHQKRAVAEFHKGGQSKAQIATKYGTSPKSLTRWIEKYK